MSKDPAVLWYTADFLAGTTLFSDEETGQYIKLLCHQHQLGHLPEKHILSVCKTKDSPVWSKFIKDEKGLWFNKRMDDEKERRAKYCSSRRRNKMQQYEEKKQPEHMSKHMENEDGNVNKNTNEKLEKLRKQIYETGFNIYEFEGKLKKEFETGLPDEVSIRVYEQLLKTNPKSVYGWLITVLPKEIKIFNAQCAEELNNKRKAEFNPKDLKDILEKIAQKSKEKAENDLS